MVIADAHPTPALEPADARTRDRVLQAVTERAPVTAAVLADSLGLTATGVRRHLDHLAEAGLIVGRETPAGPAGKRGRGRPARSWVLSDSGHDALPDDYDALAANAVRFLREHVGDDAVRAFAEQRVGEIEQRYAVELAAAGDDVRARTDALVEALRRDGFAATARPVAAVGGARSTRGAGSIGVQLCQGHCPVQHVASEFPELCEAEAEAFSRLLGVHVQRLATLAHGDHVCTTFVPTPEVRPRGGRTSTSSTTPTTRTASTTSTDQVRERSPR